MPHEEKRDKIYGNIEEKKEAALSDITAAVNHLSELVKKANRKFKEADQPTRRKIIAGAVGVAAIIAAIGIGMARKKKKRNRSEEWD